MFVEEAEKILKERERSAEEFFKEDTEETELSEPVENDTGNETDAALLSNAIIKESQGNEQDSKGTENTINKDQSKFDELSNFDEMTRALILEEDSSDNDETENDMDMFLPFKNIDERITDCKTEVKKDVTEVGLTDEITPKAPNINNESVEDSGVLTGESNEASVTSPAGEDASNTVNDGITTIDAKNISSRQHKEIVEKVEDPSNLEKLESESLRLFLEPDDEQIESSETRENIDETCKDSAYFLHNSQKQVRDDCISEKNNCKKQLFSQKPTPNTALSKFTGIVDLALLEAKLSSVGSPKLGKKTFGYDNIGRDDYIIFDDGDDNGFKVEKTDVGLDELKNRFVKHVKSKNSFAKDADVATTEPVEMTIVSKETDSEGK